MSDSKRATLITVGATKGEKNNVNKTVRLTINLDESNESKFPELNYKELVIAQVRKKVVQQNGKTAGLNPFSDNDEDVERVARKFEQKYGGKSTYGKKSKHDDFADIGAGYDENDSFIDNTDGYDEMIPPECETLYGGFYINSGLLEFKNAENAAALSDAEVGSGKRNKRRISSSSSEESSDSSSSESSEEKDPKVVANGAVDSHKTEHRKKKNKKLDKKPKKVRRTESSAATSSKQTSDDAHADAESADSRTSQSDSLTSKPAPSSENPITSDSSRDVDHKTEAKLPASVASAVEEIEAVGRLVENKDSEAVSDQYVLRIERALSLCGADNNVRRTAWSRAAKALRMSRTKLLQRARTLADTHRITHPSNSLPATATSAQVTAKQTSHTDSNIKRKTQEFFPEEVGRMTEEEREAKILETLERLKALIEERKPGMMASYNAECERVQEERKKLQIASTAEGARLVEKRLPKRRFPWCARSRALLSRLRVLAGSQEAAANLLAKRALPLFPSGFVRMPTLLRQADLNKEIKVDLLKRHRVNSSSMPVPAIQPQKSDEVHFTEPIQFPSSLTVTTMNKPDKPEVSDKNKPDKPEVSDKNKNSASLFGNIFNPFAISKDLLVEKQEWNKEMNDKKDDAYIPSNNISGLTITPVSSQTIDDKKVINSIEKMKEPLLRVKSPAALNEMVNKKEKEKALENIHRKEKEKALENKHKKEKEKALENIHKKEKDRVLENIHKDQKEKALENIHRKEKDKVLETIHKIQKDKALETIHKKEKDRALEIIHKKDKDKHKKHEKLDKQISTIKSVEKFVDSLLHIDTSYQPKQKTPTPSPKSKTEGITLKQIETMRVAENNIPRPALIPVHHSPTFAKPDKRPPEVKKKKEIEIVSDMDPLADVQQELVAIDDSSSDVEVIEDIKSDKNSDSHSVVPSDKVRDGKQVNRHKDVSHKDRSDKKSDKDDTDAMNDDFNSLMKNLRDLENSQEPKLTNSFGGAIASAKHESSKPTASSESSDKDKLAERASLNTMDGCSPTAVTGNG